MAKKKSSPKKTACNNKTKGSCNKKCDIKKCETNKNRPSLFSRLSSILGLGLKND